MSNPWLKKNPFLSVWLSGANSARGHIAAAARRQSSAATTQATKDIVDFWTGAMTGAAKPRRKKARK